MALGKRVFEKQSELGEVKGTEVGADTMPRRRAATLAQVVLKGKSVNGVGLSDHIRCSEGTHNRCWGDVCTMVIVQHDLASRT